jgi:O-methyltransferase
VKPYTEASTAPIVGICQTMAYLEKHGVPGAIVQCGGNGELMAAALALLECDSAQRQLCYFENRPNGDSAITRLKQAMMQTRYPWEKLIFVPGQATELPRIVPEQIAFLRVDLAHAENALQRLEQFYPRLSDGGILSVCSLKDESQLRDIECFLGPDAQWRPIDATERMLIHRAALSCAA